MHTGGLAWTWMIPYQSEQVKVSSVQSLDQVGHQGVMRDDPAEILFQFLSAGSPCEQFWRGQICGLFDVVHPALPLLTMALPTLQSALKVVLDRLLWHAMCLNHASFHLTFARRDSSRQTRKLTLFLLHTQSLVLCCKSKKEMQFPQALGFKSLDPLFRVHVSQPESTEIARDCTI